MYKKLLFSLVLMAIGFTTSYAQETLTVYDGSATNSYVPVYGFYADAFTKVEFIMNSDELYPMDGGTITGMTWYLSTPATDPWGGRFQIFVKEVSNTTLDAYTGMVDATIVYDGPLDGTQEELVIEFAEPYIYEGGNLLVGIYGVETGTYKSATFTGETVIGASVQGYSYSSLEACNINQRDFLPKTTFTYAPGSGVVYYKPTNIQATNIAPNSADITWTPGNEEQDLWEVVYGTGQFNPDEAEPITVNGTPTVQLTGLQENTTYTAYVRSDCGREDMSIWSKPCTFTTPLQFPLPTNLAVGKITAKSAEATWNGETASYNLRYRPKTTLSESFEDTALPAGWSVNNGWVVMPIVEYTMGGTPLVAADGSSCMADISVDEYTGAALGIDNWLISPKANLGGTLTFYASDLGASYVENYSVYVSTTGTDADDFIALGENINTPGILNQWEKKEFDLSAYAGQQGYIAIRHHNAQGYYLFIDAVTVAGEGVEAAEWIVMEDVTSPVTMEPLAAGTTYEVQVQGVYADGVSGWTELVDFTTVAADALPINLEVTNVTATTADVNWTGSQDIYNLRYRKAAILNGLVEDFTGYATGSLPTGWTVIDGDGDGQNWYVWNLTLEDGTVQTTLSSNSYLNNYGVLYPDNWVITPQSKLGEMVQFVAWGQDPSYAAEHFQVYVSTTGTDVADFVPISNEIIATGTKTTYTFDISEYAGQMGYIALRHFNVSDQYILNVTDFYMAGEEADVPAGDWIVINNVTPTYTIEGLDPATDYEVQVQGIFEGRATTEWTASAFFTTLDEEVPSTVQTEAPSISADTQQGVHAYFVTITETEDSDLYYRYCKDDGEWSDWILYDDVIPFEEDGYYQVEAYAIANGKSESSHVSCSFTVDQHTGLDELNGEKAVAGVRYFNVAGQEMAQPNGMTIVVTTYTDGTTVATKVMK